MIADGSGVSCSDKTFLPTVAKDLGKGKTSILSNNWHRGTEQARGSPPQECVPEPRNTVPLFYLFHDSTLDSICPYHYVYCLSQEQLGDINRPLRGRAMRFMKSLHTRGKAGCNYKIITMFKRKNLQDRKHSLSSGAQRSQPWQALHGWHRQLLEAPILVSAFPQS